MVMKRSELESIMAETREEEENLKEKAFDFGIVRLFALDEKLSFPKKNCNFQFIVLY